MSNLNKFFKEVGVSNSEELINLFEMTASEFDDAGHNEVARDYMFSASLIRENEALKKALGNCYMLANRRSRGVVTPENADWRHIARFCEETGMRPEDFRSHSKRNTRRLIL